MKACVLFVSLYRSGNTKGLLESSADEKKPSVKKIPLSGVGGIC